MSRINDYKWLLLLLSLAICSSCSPASSSAPKHTPAVSTSTPSQPIVLVPTPPRSEPASMPTNCPLTALPGTKVFPKGWGGFLSDTTLIGRSPVWAGMGLEVHVYTGTKILWEVGQDLMTPVTVRVKNLATGSPAWWGKGDQPPSEPILVLGAGSEGYHGAPASGWYEWGRELYLLSAGCYSMDVTWPGGAWHVVFAAGR